MDARTLPILTLVGLLLSAAAPAAAGDRCACRFEVKASGTHGVATRRATRTADTGTCEFDVRLRVDPGSGTGCDGGVGTMRGLRSVAPIDPWAMPWERVSLRPRKHGTRRTVLRARIRGGAGGTARARLALRCVPPLAGCEQIMAEPLYCVIGGGDRPRIASPDTGATCGNAQNGAGTALLTPSLAFWQGEIYSCGGGSPAGSFVATPLAGGTPRRVAGPCAAAGTDGDTLLVVPRAGFDDAGAPPDRLSIVVPAGLPPEHLRQIRAYDTPEDVPDGAARVVVDLDAVPAGSPCGALLIDTVTGDDGVVYAAGCIPDGSGGCVRDQMVCAYDAATGRALAPVFLQEFTGTIRGLSAIGGGRLVVLSDDQTVLPPIGYGGAESSGQPADTLHVFDVTDGARLDTQPIGTFGAQGLDCVSH